MLLDNARYEGAVVLGTGLSALLVLELQLPVVALGVAQLRVGQLGVALLLLLCVELLLRAALLLLLLLLWFQLLLLPRGALVIGKIR